MRTRRGFSLIESVVAAGIVGILMLAVTGVLGLAARAMPTEDDLASRSARAATVLEDLADDLASASAVVAATPTTLRLRVPDRDGDAASDVVTYDFNAGVLTRRLNGRSPGIVLSGLESFAFDSQWISLERRVTTTATLGAAGRVAGYTFASGRTFRVGGTDQIAQIVIPRLDEDVISWTPTSIRVQMSMRSGVLSSITCRIFDGDITKGQLGPLLATGVDAAVLSGSSAGWVSFGIGGAPEIARGKPVTIILSALNLLSTTDVVRETSGIYDGFLSIAQSSNAGGSWTGSNEGSMGFEIIGMMRRPVKGSATSSRLAGMVVDMRLGGVGRIRRTLAVPGRPLME